MADAVSGVELKSEYHKLLIEKVRKEWDFWDQREAKQNDDRLQFDSFYHGFLQPYFGCSRCATTKKALRVLDMDADGYVDWKEFLVYIKWALRQYPNVTEVDELMSIAFEKGLVPAMRDERKKQNLFNHSTM